MIKVDFFCFASSPWNVSMSIYWTFFDAAISIRHFCDPTFRNYNTKIWTIQVYIVFYWGMWVSYSKRCTPDTRIYALIRSYFTTRCILVEGVLWWFVGKRVFKFQVVPRVQGKCLWIIFQGEYYSSSTIKAGTLLCCIQTCVRWLVDCVGIQIMQSVNKAIFRCKLDSVIHLLYLLRCQKRCSTPCISTDMVLYIELFLWTWKVEVLLMLFLRLSHEAFFLASCAPKAIKCTSLHSLLCSDKTDFVPLERNCRIQ